MIPWMIELWQLRKEYPTPTGPAVVVKDFTLKVREGEFVCIIGHSGCGKSTVLSILMGLNTATSGNVVVGGKEIAGPGRDRGVVFQTAALLPWITVRDNVRLAIEARQGAPTRKEGNALADQYLAQVGLENIGDCKPEELSAGMRQLVGIARAFAIQPKMLLLDEPFGALDALTRGTIQDELVRICEATHQTVFMITHDVDEAILLADRIMLMSNGPGACIAEIVLNPVAKPRERHSIHHAPQYYGVRNHLVDFLVNRSKRYQSGELRAQRVSSAKIVNLR